MDYSVCLSLLIRLMIFWQFKHTSTSVRAHYSSAVSNISNITDVINNKHNYGTAARVINESFVVCFSRLFHGLISSVFNNFKEEVLSLHEAISNCFNGICRERLLLNYELMKIVSQEVSTWSTSMAVINRKEWACRPILNVFKGRLCDIEDDWNSIFVIVSTYEIRITWKRLGLYLQRMLG